MIYFSTSQREVLKRKGALADFAKHLPCWIPASAVARGLGFSNEGIANALKSLNGVPYVWATEFENVHSTWTFFEPRIEIDGVMYADSETYYHAQKPRPFSNKLWKPRRVGIMRRGVREKFKNKKLSELLKSTYPHPLLSIKSDCFWGFDAKRGGENMLAKILMELRDELIATATKKRGTSTKKNSTTAK